MTIEHLELVDGEHGWSWTITDETGRQVDADGPYATRDAAVADVQARHGERAPRLLALDDAKPASGPLQVDYRVEFP